MHDQTNTVDNDFTETVKKNASITITEGKYSHDVKTGTADFHVQGAVTEKYDATQSTKVASDITIVSSGGAIAVAADAKHVYIKGATSIQLVVGGSNIWIDSGQISLTSAMVNITGKSTVTIKGGIVHSEAEAQHQTTGALVLSEAKGSNTIKGAMVMLNP